MGAQYKAYIFAVFLLFSAFGCTAKELTGISAEALNIAYKNYDRARKNYEAAISSCDESKNILPLSIIDSLGVSEDQLKYVLFTLNRRAVASCLNKTEEIFFHASAVYRETAKHYKVSDKNALEYSEDILFSYHWRFLESEAEYLRLDKHIRDKIEKIESFKVPFNAIEAMEKIRLRRGD